MERRNRKKFWHKAKKMQTSGNKKLKAQGKDHDVIVVGGGTAGVVAAVASARQGAKTLVIESTGAFGGMGTNGMIPTLCPYSFKSEPLIKGIGLEILKRLHKKNLSEEPDESKSFSWVAIDAEKLKLVYDEMITESGCDYLLFTHFSGVIMEDNIIRGITVENKGGRKTLSADVFIDCTGDADVAFRAGAPFAKGDASGKLQASTLCFAIGNIDLERYLDFYQRIGGQNGLRKLIKESEHNGKLPVSDSFEYILSADSFRKEDGVMALNLGHLYGIDGTDAAQVSKAMIDGRKFAHFFVNFARKNIPGMEKSFITASANLLGIRETRRITGDFIMPKESFYEGRHFEDDIACYDYPIDVHESRKTASKEDENLFAKTAEISKSTSYGIPFRVMVAKNVENLLVAGRSISADRAMLGSLRVMPACFAMGQAAGTAAALASKQNVSLSEVDINKLKEFLE